MLKLPDGSSYSGQFEHGVVSDSAKQHRKGGQETQCHHGLQVHGFAAYTLPTGAKYEGEQGAWPSWRSPHPILTLYAHPWSSEVAARKAGRRRQQDASGRNGPRDRENPTCTILLAGREITAEGAIYQGPAIFRPGSLLRFRTCLHCMAAQLHDFLNS